METELEKILALDEFEMNIGRIKYKGRNNMSNKAMSSLLNVNKGINLTVEDLKKDVQAIKKNKSNINQPYFSVDVVENLIERIQFLEKALAHSDNYAQTLNVKVNELMAKPAGIMITEKQVEVSTSESAFTVPDHQHTRTEQIVNIETLVHFINELSGMTTGDSINNRIASAKKLEFYVKEMKKYFGLDFRDENDDAIIASFLEALIIAKKIKPALETLAI